MRAALEMPREVGAALLATAEGYTPRATKFLDEAREQLGSIEEIAAALADDLPAPKTGPSRSRRRRRRKKRPGEAPAAAEAAPTGESTTAELRPGEPSANGDAPTSHAVAGAAAAPPRRPRPSHGPE